ncbi:MAG: hypothetical protein C4K48_06295 [Candidatus Thorarchaeota archaeon]|nr:MAG: hypothetical protein C4K48_06295 [Candidatus Thorarchaeota archaeon]
MLLPQNGQNDESIGIRLEQNEHLEPTGIKLSGAPAAYLDCALETNIAVALVATMKKANTRVIRRPKLRRLESPTKKKGKMKNTPPLDKSLEDNNRMLPSAMRRNPKGSRLWFQRIVNPVL